MKGLNSLQGRAPVILAKSGALPEELQVEDTRRMAPAPADEPMLRPRPGAPALARRVLSRR